MASTDLKKRTSVKDKFITIRISEKMHQAIVKVALVDDRTVASVIRKAIEKAYKCES